MAQPHSAPPPLKDYVSQKRSLVIIYLFSQVNLGHGNTRLSAPRNDYSVCYLSKVRGSEPDFYIANY